MTEILSLGFDAWLTAAVLVAILVGLVREWLGPDILVTAGVTLLVVTGVLEPAAAFSGFANLGVLAIAGLFIVARGVEDSGALDRMAHWLLGMQTSERGALLRTMVATASISSVLNNTPVVAMIAPAVRRWARLHGISPKRLLIPVSYAAILGGVCTLVGTSTNLVIAGLMADNGMGQLGMFELSKIGLPVAIVGTLAMMLVGRHLLPNELEPLPTTSETVAVPESSQTIQPALSGRRQVLVLLMVALMIAVPAFTSIDLVASVFVVVLLMLFSGLVSPRAARESVHIEVIVTIAMAFGLGKAMTESGLASAIGHLIVSPAAPYGSLALLAAVFLVTSIFTEVITNNAAAVLMFPIVHAVALETGFDARPLMLMVAVAASCSFATPLGYQTNMMVAQLGGYRFAEFLRVGVFMNVITWLTAVTFAWLWWG